MSRLVLNRDGGKTDEFGHMLGLSRMTTGEVIEGLTVVQQVAPNMSVLVQPGSAKIQFGSGGGRYDYWVANDSDASVTLPTADTSNPRIDIILAVVDRSVTPDPMVTNNSNNMFKFVVASGTPAAIASDPTSGQMQAAAGVGNPYIRLARIYVDANRTQITNTQIVGDLRTFVYTNRATVDWTPAPGAATYSSHNGQKEYVLNVGADVTGVWAPGTKLRIPRTNSVATQSGSFISSSGQYANRTTSSGITFTDDWTCETWLYVDSYTGFGQGIITRTDDANGFAFRINVYGTLEMYGLNGAGGANYKTIETYQSIPIGRWVHVAATMDMSNFTASTCKIFIDGVDVPARLISGGSNPTSLTQAGGLQLGSINGTSGSRFLNGKMSNARIWNSVRTASQIRDNMSSQLTTATNLVANFPLNGSWNDISGNANNLTPISGASNNFSSCPLNSIEYAVVTKVGSYSSGNTPVTVFTGFSGSIPNESLGQLSYSSSRSPYGFPSAKELWRCEYIHSTQIGLIVPTVPNYYTIGNVAMIVPSGEWILGYNIPAIVTAGSGGGLYANGIFGLSKTNNQKGDQDLEVIFGGYFGNQFGPVNQTISKLIKNDSMTPYYGVVSATLNNASVYISGSNRISKIYAQCPYI